MKLDDSRELGNDLWTLGVLSALATAVRGVFLYRLDVPSADPWRHLKLVENLRAGVGFTLYDGQPYIWYFPLWHRLCAVLPRSVPMEWTAAFFSILAVGAIYLWLRSAGETRAVAASAGGMAAAFGPMVAFTCHYGSEAMALFLAFAALALLAMRSGTLAAIASGVAFGLATTLRMSLLFDGFLFLPELLRRPHRTLPFAGGFSLPLALTWFRNHEVIRAHPFVFTWDGLATRSADFDLLSTLVIQMHPAVQEGLRRLHQYIAPVPEWIRDPGGIRWDLIVFMACGIAGVALCRRLGLILAAASTLFYFLVLDRTLSSNFFRIYLGLFPVMFAGVALAASRLEHRVPRRAAVLAWVPAAVVVLLGTTFLEPPVMYPLELLSPPEEAMTEDTYLVNSAFYYPECLAYRFPEKRFLGLPLLPAELEEFERAFPGYRTVLWHDFSIQDELAIHLAGKHPSSIAHVTNDFGRGFSFIGLDGAPGDAAPETEP